MLAILLIEMEWHKAERNLKGALLRQKYYHPVPVAKGVKLSGEGAFVVKCSYYQQGDMVLSNQDVLDGLQKEFRQKLIHPAFGERAFTAGDEHEQRRALRQKESIRKSQGAFYEIGKLDIPCVAFYGEQKDAWRVRWYDDGRGQPRRRGGNEECYWPGAKLAGRVNTLNETAFLLSPGEAGVLKYNYRFTSYEDQWYKCYYTYVVNAKTLTEDVFLREYDYEYGQMADLF